MAQGKPYTQEQKDRIIESLAYYLRLGYSRNKACAFIGFDETTLCKWAKADESLSMKLVGYENEINVRARANWRNSIMDKNPDLKASQEWLQARERQEFGKNIDLTSAGEKIVIDKVIVEIDDPLNKKD